MKPVTLSSESRCLMGIGLLFGLLTVVFVPPIVTFDGPSHYFRALQIARGQFRPDQYSERRVGGEFPGRDSRFVHTLWSSYWIDHRFLTLSGWSALSRSEPKDPKKVREEFTNTAVYSPANYVPQSLAMAVTRIFTRSPLSGHRAACTLNLFCYLTLVVLALETMPRFQHGVVLIATSPLLLIQSATINVDAINFAVPLCLFALVWKMRSAPMGDHGFRLIAVTCFAIFTALLKPTDMVCLGFLLFLPTQCFGSLTRKIAWLVGTSALALGSWFVWNSPYSDVDIEGWFFPNRPPLQFQKDLLFKDPANFLVAFQGFLQHDLLHELTKLYSFVGLWIPQWVDSFVSGAAWVFLAVLFLKSNREGTRNWSWAAICFMHGVALVSLIALALWLVNGSKDIHYIPGFTGRYLFLSLTFVLVAWSELVGLRGRITGNFLFAAGLAANISCLALILFETAAKTAG